MSLSGNPGDEAKRDDESKMADIYFYQEEDGDDGDGGGSFGDDDLSCNPDDLLPPVRKLEKYADSENIFNRQIVARTVLETLRSVVDEPSDVEAVLTVMNKLADDVEPSVRAELMEQVPHVAMFCQEYKQQLSSAVPAHLLPMVVKFLTDSNNQVRKTSQAALLVLLEQGLVERSDVQDQVCPVISRLTESDSMDDYRTEAVALLSKMAPLIGKEMVESLFLERFAALCMDPLFHVRKLCAANFGDFSSVVGSEPTETVLLPKFFYLCEDGVWGVRKACAEVFMPVSCVCSPTVRKAELAPLLINLLRDQSRWVRMAAYQALGPFISTFADPSITALLHNDNGEIVITEPDTLARRLNELEAEREAEREADRLESNPVIGRVEGGADVVPEQMDLSSGEDANSSLVASSGESSFEERRASKLSSAPGDKAKTTSTADVDQSFNSFNYWRDPLPTVDEDGQKSDEGISSMDGESNSDDTKGSVAEIADGVQAASIAEDEEKTEDSDSSNESGAIIKASEADDDETKAWKKLPIITFQTFDNLTDTGAEGATMELFRPADTSLKREDSESSSRDDESISTFDPHGSETFSVETTVDLNKSSEDYEPPLDPALPRGPPATNQNIVPQLLIDHYVSMLDPSRAQTVDSDIAMHCAFSLPAVALTLGRYNWPLLKDTYEALATDMQWKVRRTLASSIHELGVILGKETSGRDLIPVFNGFLKDLDEVRQGLLKHLADFLELLEPEFRQDYLPKLTEFLKMDNERNWRFRQELAQQLERLIPLFTPCEVEEHISPIAMVLVHDKVSAVRGTITRVLASILRSLFQSERPQLGENLLHCVTESLAREPLWIHRQTYAALCRQLRESEAVDEATFCSELLPELLELAGDKVPNVRLVAARTLKSVSTAGYDANPHRERLAEVERALMEDPDVDVRQVYCVYAHEENGGGLTVVDRDAMLEDTGIALDHVGIGELDSIKASAL